MQEYRDIPGYEGIYQASNDGVIRSVDRYMPSKRHGGTQFFKGRVLRPSVHRDGYRCVNLQRNGRIVSRLVHRLVYESFRGAIPDGLQVNHIDGDKSNNGMENLCVVTASPNCIHRDSTGLRVAVRGSQHGSSKLTENAVSAIKSAVESGLPQNLVASSFRVSPSTVHLIMSGKTWRHVKSQHTEVLVCGTS